MADQQGNQSDARKEMEMLIKLEAATTVPKAPIGRGGRAIHQAGTPVGGGGSWMQSKGATVPEEEEEEQTTPREVSSAERDLIRTITEKVGLEYVNIRDYQLDSADAQRLRSYIPAAEARKRRIFPLAEETTPGFRPRLTIAIADALDITIVDDLAHLLPNYEIHAVVADEQEIVDAIDKFYGIGDESIEEAVEALNEDLGRSQSFTKGGEVEIDIEQLANDPPVIKIVNLLLMEAIQQRASDLHIEPFASKLRIRYRVDGLLREIQSPPKAYQVGIISRLKVMAGMNIAETRMPQDGRIRLSIAGKEVDLRVASVPIVHGEAIVMRVLDKSTMMIGIRQLGFQQEILGDVLKEASKPNGIVLVTGPTGCGKTTTLYSILNEIFDSGMKFITTEDPVEYELAGIVQVNINAKVDLTFARCLRAILRQDPDVILVGEIRDVETAQISIQAALTGHMVFSTLHTNSAAATVTRLIDMGLEPFLISSTLRGIVGQRLIRTICPSCRDEYHPTDKDLAEFAVTREQVEDITFFKGRGCDECNKTGYKGRLGIFEFLKITDEICELILQRSTTDEIHALAVHQGMQSMRTDGWMKVCMGVTTFDEVARQTPSESEESIRLEMESAQKSLEKIEEARRRREMEDTRQAAEDEGAGQFGVPKVISSGREDTATEE
jgi:type II secretory ATPase GspE/PulE/Tfp pilus assembly ATPase PilB-like protein